MWTVTVKSPTGDTWSIDIPNDDVRKNHDLESSDLITAIYLAYSSFWEKVFG